VIARLQFVDEVSKLESKVLAGGGSRGEGGEKEGLVVSEEVDGGEREGSESEEEEGEEWRPEGAEWRSEETSWERAEETWWGCWRPCEWQGCTRHGSGLASFADEVFRELEVAGADVELGVAGEGVGLLGREVDWLID
jgi:hypothetical protein